MIQPIQSNAPIVNSDGRPSAPFLFFINQLLNALSSSASSLAQQAYDLATALVGRKINTGTGLQGGGDLSADRTLSLTNTTVTPGSYGDATHVGQFTVDQQGRLTAAANVAVSGGGGGGSPKFDKMSLFSGSWSVSGGAQNAKATRITPLVNVSISALTADMVSQVVGATYVAYIITTNGAGTITAILATSAAITAVTAAAQLLLFNFSSPVALTAGSDYALLIARTNGTTTTALTIYSTSGVTEYTASPVVIKGFASYLSLAPSVGTTANAFSTSLATYRIGYLWT